MRGRIVAVLAALAACDAPAQPPRSDDEAPDLELLEYLGSFEGSDEDWLVVDEWRKRERRRPRREPPPENADDEDE